MRVVRGVVELVELVELGEVVPVVVELVPVGETERWRRRNPTGRWTRWRVAVSAEAAATGGEREGVVLGGSGDQGGEVPVEFA